MNRQEKEAYVEGLRKLADVLETKIDKPEFETVFYSPVVLNLWAADSDHSKKLGRAVGGRRDKVLNGHLAIQRRRVGPHRIEVNLSRELVCERVQVGTVTIPAQEARPERTEPQYEWKCPDDYKVAS